MTTLVLQFARELKTAASQICSSMKSGKRIISSTLLVVFQYLLYSHTVQGFSIFRSIHLPTPLLIPFFLLGARGNHNLYMSVLAPFVFWPYAHSLNSNDGTRCKLSALHLFWQVASVIDSLHHSLGCSFPAWEMWSRNGLTDRTAEEWLSQLEYLLHIFSLEWHLRQTWADVILGTVTGISEYHEYHFIVSENLSFKFWLYH